MATMKENLINWLADAHGMEQHALTLLAGQEKRIENYPEILIQVKKHKEETAWQSSQIDKCLKILGADPSTFKKLTGRLSANAAALTTMMASDEIIKDSIANSAFEHLEIATYTAIISAAEASGEQEVADICREILAQEQEMAAWLDGHLPQMATTFLMRDATGTRAKI
jgi:ferritin-like metal-binding protein YciE